MAETMSAADVEAQALLMMAGYCGDMQRDFPQVCTNMFRGNLRALASGYARAVSNAKSSEFLFELADYYRSLAELDRAQAEAARPKFSPVILNGGKL